MVGSCTYLDSCQLATLTAAIWVFSGQSFGKIPISWLRTGTREPRKRLRRISSAALESENWILVIWSWIFYPRWQNIRLLFIIGVTRIEYTKFKNNWERSQRKSRQLRHSYRRGKDNWERCKYIRQQSANLIRWKMNFCFFNCSCSSLRALIKDDNVGYNLCMHTLWALPWKTDR